MTDTIDDRTPTDLFSFTPIQAIPIDSITIPPDRQRKNAKADEALLSSIQSQGLLNPIIVHKDLTLVAGERRLDAFRQLGRTHIPARLFEDLTPRAAHLVELQENLARKQLTWQEEAKAIFDYHQQRVDDYAAWTVLGTAGEIGMSNASIARILTVARMLDDPDVFGAATLTGAFNLLEARADRKLAAAQARGIMVGDAISKTMPAVIPPNASKEEKTAILMAGLEDTMLETAEDVGSLLDKIERSELADKALREAAENETIALGDDRILTGSFLDWAPAYTGPAFDVIHCDFPYGKEYKGSNTRKTGRVTSTPTYADGADIYFELVDTFLTYQDRFVLPQAHCIFWFDMMHYCWTIEQFRNAGWTLVQPHPLLWTKSYQGVAADTKRRPRHCYETALFFSRGDRKLRKLDKDYFEMRGDEKLHISQKPLLMLKHFLSLIVDEHTAVFDPTCGSGTALAAAGQLGASRIFGIELEEGNADVARFMLGRELDNAAD